MIQQRWMHTAAGVVLYKKTIEHREKRYAVETATERVRASVKDHDWDQFHTLGNLAKSICIEIGELLECFQWDPEKHEHRTVCEEFADVMIYHMQLADKLRANTEDVTLGKMEKNEKKCPVEEVRKNAAKYNAYE